MTVKGRLEGLLCSCNARPQKGLAWANGTSRRASGWEGGKDTRSGRPSRLPSRERIEEQCLVRCAQSRTALAAPPKERGRGYWNTLRMTHVLACQ